MTTEVNTGAVEEAEITALLTHQVTVKKVAQEVMSKIQEVMTLVPEVILSQEMIITVVVLAALLREAVLHLQLTQDMPAKSAKKDLKLKGN